jgi:hypothetical protein
MQPSFVWDLRGSCFHTVLRPNWKVVRQWDATELQC